MHFPLRLFLSEQHGDCDRDLRGDARAALQQRIPPTRRRHVHPMETRKLIISSLGSLRRCDVAETRNYPAVGSLWSVVCTRFAAPRCTAAVAQEVERVDW